VVAVEPELTSRALAQKAASRAAVPIRVVDGVAEQLPVDDNTLDVAVTSLILCSVHDPPPRSPRSDASLRPGRELRFYEHIRAHEPASPVASAWWTSPGPASLHRGRVPVQVAPPMN
jgi:hypothetical protein